MAPKRFNAAALGALRDALTHIYWYKPDQRRFLCHVLDGCPILGSINWDAYKRQISDQVVSALARDAKSYVTELQRLFLETAAIDDFSHLSRLDDGEKKALAAFQSVAALRKYTAGHEDILESHRESQRRQSEAVKRSEGQQSFQKKLAELNQLFLKMTASSDPQKRGYDLEKLFREMFSLFDLDPKASFKLEAEQIDGAFCFDGTDFLLEARWHAARMDANSLYSLEGKLNRKLDNTLGLFVSINGFTPGAISANSSGRRTLLLMDGADLMIVLDGRLDLNELLRLKKRHAVQTGEVFLSATDVLKRTGT